MRIRNLHGHRWFSSEAWSTEQLGCQALCDPHSRRDLDLGVASTCDLLRSLAQDQQRRGFFRGIRAQTATQFGLCALFDHPG